MTAILITSIIISLFCCGLTVITQEGMIFYFIRRPFEHLYGWRAFLAKPLIICPPCMASLWGVLVYYLLHGFEWQLILCCIISAFLNRLFMALLEITEA